MTDQVKLALHNKELEYRVLSCLMTYPGLMSESSDVLSENSFYFTQCKILYHAICEVYNGGNVPDLLSVSMYLKRNPVEGAPEMYEIAEISDAAHTRSTFEQDLATLSELAKRRDYWLLGQKLMAVGTDPTLELTDIESEMDKVRERNLLASHDVYSMQQANDMLKIRVSMNQRNDKSTMLITGFPSLDERGGFQLSDLNLIGGATSMGKSTFTTNLLVNVARSGTPTMCFTLEMTVEQMAARINAQMSKVPSYVTLFKKLHTDQIHYLESAMKESDKLPLYIDDSVTTYESLKDSIRSNAIRRGIKLFAVDYLQTLGSIAKREKSENEASFYERICRELKNLAKELKVCIVLVVQFSRIDKNNPRPDMSMIRGSGGIEQAADTILLLYRPDYYGREHKYRKDIPSRVTEVIIDKGRQIGGKGVFFADYKDETFFEYQTELKTPELPKPSQTELPF